MKNLPIIFFFTFIVNINTLHYELRGHRGIKYLQTIINETENYWNEQNIVKTVPDLLKIILTTNNDNNSDIYISQVNNVLDTISSNYAAMYLFRFSENLTEINENIGQTYNLNELQILKLKKINANEMFKLAKKFQINIINLCSTNERVDICCEKYRTLKEQYYQGYGRFINTSIKGLLYSIFAENSFSILQRKFKLII